LLQAYGPRIEVTDEQTLLREVQVKQRGEEQQPCAFTQVLLEF